MRRYNLVAGAGLLVATLTTFPENSRADQFHYRNFVMGDRAVGLGGAYAGISDDASGVMYNPAGLAFALSNDISGSANAFYSKQVTYKSAICDDDFEEFSDGSLPAFFGVLQKVDKYVPGLVVAFGSYATDDELKDQDDLIENKPCGAVTIRRFHRTSNQRANTQYHGLAAGYRITPTMALGFGMNYFQVSELVQEYQDGKQNFSSNGDFWRILTQNIRQKLTVYGIEPVLGFQWAFGGQFSLGLSYRHGSIVSENLEISTELRTATVTTASLRKLEEKDPSASGAVSEQITFEKAEKPMGDWPSQTRLGMAWFATTRLLLALDIVHYGEAKGGEEVKSFGRKIYQREAVTNYAFGAEFYALPSFPVRFGIFTNNDARPTVEEGDYDPDSGNACSVSSSSSAAIKAKSRAFKEKYCGQPDHIDYLGESLFIAWVQPNSQIAVGAVLQQGTGKAQKLGDHQVQDVVASSRTFAFSATHNF